jgi:hypothetical protein
MDLWLDSCDSVVFSTNKTDHHDKAEVLLKAALNTIPLTQITVNKPLNDPNKTVL